jgi:hypothetical protein
MLFRCHRFGDESLAANFDAGRLGRGVVVSVPTGWAVDPLASAMLTTHPVPFRAHISDSLILGQGLQEANREAYYTYELTEEEW